MNKLDRRGLPWRRKSPTTETVTEIWLTSPNGTVAPVLLKPTGNHSVDSALGRTVANVYLNFITTSGACSLQWVVGDMPEGNLSALEVGFLRAIEEAAACGHMCNEGRPFRR